MKAAVFRGKSKSLEIAQVPDPTPGNGQVVIKVGRCGICGSDLHMAAGHTYSFEEGAIPGHEFAGEIVAMGRDAAGVAVGDRVAVLPFNSCGRCQACLNGEPGGCAKNRIMGTFGVQGGYAEYVLADALWCVQLPASLGFDDGALVEPLAVSLRANRVSGIKGGDRVLVIGAGAIGIAAAYWARYSGASRIAVAATSNRREAIARAVGADAFITPEPDRKIADQSRAALCGEADIVFECAGVAGSLDMAVSAVKRGGMISAPGFCWSPDMFTPMVAMIKEVTIKFTNVYDVREFEIAIGALDRGRVEPRAMITDVVGLDATPAAFAGLMNRNHQCKVLIAPGD
jgi:(R,R)-butanediol dehydrogenase/meso-butanediol dehydrogenase/diacetyl reductase